MSDLQDLRAVSVSVTLGFHSLGRYVYLYPYGGETDVRRKVALALAATFSSRFGFPSNADLVPAMSNLKWLRAHTRAVFSVVAPGDKAVVPPYPTNLVEVIVYHTLSPIGRRSKRHRWMWAEGSGCSTNMSNYWPKRAEAAAAAELAWPLAFVTQVGAAATGDEA